MPLTFDQKEDLRLRMADLEKKLAESEEERCKLEKTCNVLIRAFREEERIQYKALNEKYEKFLEDCAVRKRRNDIILRSLSKIEDRSRAIFAKTERLKLLKDRHISCLKINECTERGKVYTQSYRSITYSPRSQDLTNGVRWSTPIRTSQTVDSREIREIISSRNISPTRVFRPLSDRSNKSEEITNGEITKTRDIRVFGRTSNTTELEKPSVAQDEFKPTKTGFDIPTDLQAESESYQLKKGKLAPNQLNSENLVSGKYTLNDKRSTGITSLREPLFIGQDGTVEKKYGSFPSRETPEPYKIPEDTQKNEIDFPENQNFETSNMRISDEKEEEKFENSVFENEMDVQTKYQEEDSPRSPKALPRGLDGVDYQNETYPESYYEQPIHHHNHTSIASDVILEEDETEQDMEESDAYVQHPGEGAPLEPQGGREENKTKDDEPTKSVAINEKAFDQVRDQEFDSEKTSDAKNSSEKSEIRERLEGMEKNKPTVKSNLIHLLESDSESFQIEHGDGISGNDDTDFDFSFHEK